MKTIITALMLAVVVATGAGAAFAKPTQDAGYSSRADMVQSTGN